MVAKFDAKAYQKKYYADVSAFKRYVNKQISDLSADELLARVRSLDLDPQDEAARERIKMRALEKQETSDKKIHDEVMKYRQTHKLVKNKNGSYSIVDR